ncbi:MAG: ribosome biogenesis GTPase Der [Deltaproteobacteria bacterium]|jgi:GTP-binding protein|nr:ribosome biogenesis GTPase Der [Deltaproteobacteria bacterium]
MNKIHPATVSLAARLTGLPKVALLGRPNVGKSTLFNRLIRSRRAITHDLPGVTRDRMEGAVLRRGLPPFVLIDTGGVSLDAHAAPQPGPVGLRGLEAEVMRQAERAMEEAEVLCLVADGREGLTPLDAHLADFLRRTDKPLLLAVNKVDGEERADLLLTEFYALGLPLLPCSAEHGYNMGALLEELAGLLPPGAPQSSNETDETALPTDGTADEETPETAEKAPMRLALLGRPNVGKSSLLNALAGEDRMIVSPAAGTTRDSVDVPVQLDGVPGILVDSAGVRRRSKITDTLERFSVNSSIKSSTKAQLTLLVLDGQEGLTQQDKRLLELLDERKLTFMVLVNKADLIPTDKLREVERSYRQALAYCPHVPLLMVSAFNRRNLKKIAPLARDIMQESRLRLNTGRLNRLLEDMLQERQPPLIKGARAKFHYLTQAETEPPTFVFFVNDPERVNDAYSRYLERALRRMLGIKHAPIRLRLRGRRAAEKV